MKLIAKLQEPNKDGSLLEQVIFKFLFYRGEVFSFLFFLPFFFSFLFSYNKFKKQKL
jgi:Sec-independent protein secretion pathway component TatC